VFHKKPVHLSALSGLQASNNIDRLYEMEIKGSYVYNGDTVMTLFLQKRTSETKLKEVGSDNGIKWIQFACQDNI